MTSFSYRALGRDGTEIRGSLQAENEQAAILKIRRNYPVLLSIRKQSEKRSLRQLLELELGGRQIKPKILSVLCSQIAIMLRSGMTIAQVIHILAEQSTEKQLRRMMKQAAKEVEAGSTVAHALEQYQSYFPPTFIETVRIGEEAGTLDVSFERLAQFYEKSYQTREKIKSALTYPVFVIVVAMIVLFFVIANVLPTLVGVFAELDGELPALTRMLIRMSDFLADTWIAVLLFLLLLSLLFSLYGKTPNGKLLQAKCALLLPYIGTVNRLNAAAQFADTLTVLMQNGIVLDRAVSTTARVMENALFQKEVAAIQTDMEEGYSLSDCLRAASCFPAAMVDMCAVGEESGDLEHALKQMADYCSHEADYRTQRFLVLLEPMLLLALSLFAGILVAAIYLPIFTMYDFI